jgi:hypothetical protein
MPCLFATLNVRRSSAIMRSPNRRLGWATVLGTAVLLLSTPSASRSQQSPTQKVSDEEFWSVFSKLSEAGGSFVSENFISNEMSFQYVIPALQRQLTPGGVYLGVGPEQNYTYIANLRPQLAVIFDIRRQNAMQHLLYKALFEQSATRAEFVAKLFSRPTVARLGTGVSAKELFAVADTAAVSDSAFDANQKAVIQQLTVKHGFALPSDDVGTITYLYRVFQAAGPSIDYSYRLGRGTERQNRYPYFGMLQTATNADSVPMAFLGTEENYRRVRAMHQQNLIIPVVGDFAGPSAIRSVGDMLRKRNLKVTAFYLSNVEQYLFRSREAPKRFYDNVAALPLDSTATFIRSVPGSPGMFNLSPSGPGSGLPGGATFSVSILDSGGVRVMRTVQDSAGVPVTRTTVDSTSVLVPPLPLRAGTPLTFGGLLTSGLMPMRDMLNAFNRGHVQTYQDVIGMTRTSGWR